MGLFSFLESKTDKIDGIEFPKLTCGKKHSSYKRNTNKYKRKGYYYQDVTDMDYQNYISQIQGLGYSPKNDVRYENSSGNYVIIEKVNKYVYFNKKELVHIAFHVKK
jgi:hypothetical protein